MAPSNLGFHNPCLPVRVPITHLLLVCASSLLILFFFWFAQSSNNKSFQPRMHTVFLSSCRNSKTNSWDAFCIIEKLVFFSILVLYNCFGLVVLESVQDIRVCLRGNIRFMRGIEELCQIIICNFFETLISGMGRWQCGLQAIQWRVHP